MKGGREKRRGFDLVKGFNDVAMCHPCIEASFKD